MKGDHVEVTDGQRMYGVDSCVRAEPVTIRSLDEFERMYGADAPRDARPLWRRALDRFFGA